MTQESLLEESAKLRHDARETSRLAALRAAPRSATLRHAAMLAIIEAGDRGATDDELSALLHSSGNSVRPRRVELVEGGWCAPGSREAKSFYDNPAIAWVATPKALAWLAGEPWE